MTSMPATAGRPSGSLEVEQPADLGGLLRQTTGTTSPRGARRGLLNPVLWALAAVPSLALFLLLTMVVRVRLSDGVWPSRNQPDPKELGIHNTLTLVAIVCSFLAVVAVPLIALASASVRRRWPDVRPILFGLIGVLVLYGVLRLDPGGIGDWIAD